MSATKKPFLIIFSKRYISGLLFIDLIKDNRLVISNVFVETSKFSITKFLLKSEEIGNWDFKLSNSITLPLLANFEPNVLAFNFNLKGSKTIFIFFNSTSRFWLFFLIFFIIWLLNLEVSNPIKLK